MEESPPWRYPVRHGGITYEHLPRSLGSYDTLSQGLREYFGQKITYFDKAKHHLKLIVYDGC